MKKKNVYLQSSTLIHSQIVIHTEIYGYFIILFIGNGYDLYTLIISYTCNPQKPAFSHGY